MRRWWVGARDMPTYKLHTERITAGPIKFERNKGTEPSWLKCTKLICWHVPRANLPVPYSVQIDLDEIDNQVTWITGMFSSLQKSCSMKSKRAYLEGHEFILRVYFQSYQFLSIDHRGPADIKEKQKNSEAFRLVFASSTVAPGRNYSNY